MALVHAEITGEVVYELATETLRESMVMVSDMLFVYDLLATDSLQP